MSDTYTVGIEEEYFLVDAATKAIATARPRDFFAAAKEALDSQVMGEMLQSQIEVATVPHVEMATARTELRRLRRTVADVAAAHGLAILAAGTHPTAQWIDSRHSPAERYDGIMHDLQMLGRRNMVCGMHVHVELPETEDRVDVMYRMLPYLPLFIALATSSPFWQSHRTGLMGYRLAAYDELPRTGVPELFRRRAEFDEYVAALTQAGVMEDSSYVWWAIRPSLNLPTLELRAPDSCTFVDDAVAVAALYRSLARRLVRNPWLNWDMTAVTRAIIVENKWRAQRYGVHGTLVGLDSHTAVPISEFVDRVVDEVMPDAEALGCVEELLRCRTIAGAGTSADAQLAVFDAHEKVADRDHALVAVADWLVNATLQ
jgi:glutamate---cysteine ligase / carboxylate-amine ligase